MFCQLKIFIHFQNRSKDFKSMFFFMVVVMYLCCLVLTIQIMCVHMNSHVFSNGLQASLVTQMDDLQQSIESHKKSILNMPKAMEVSFVLSTTFYWTIFFPPIAILHYPMIIVHFHVQRHHAKSTHVAYSNIYPCTILF